MCKTEKMTKQRLLILLSLLLLGIGFSLQATAQDEFDVIFETEEEADEEVNPGAYTPPAKRNLITPEEFTRLQQEGKAFLLDVRGKAELKYGVIKNTINIPLYVLDAEHKKLPRDREIIIFCDNGMRALFAYDVLIGKGFTKLRFLNNSVRFSVNGDYEIIIPPKRTH